MQPPPMLAEAPPNKSDDRRPLSQLLANSEDHRPSTIGPPPSDHASHADANAPQPVRKNTTSSVSTVATALTTTTTLAAEATATAAGTPFSSVVSSPTYPAQPTQGVFSARDGSNVPPQRRPTRRRVGPLTAVQRERAHLIRKMGACADCRRRRVACHPNHHNMTWEEAARRFRSHEPSQELPPIRGSQLSAVALTSGQEPRAMDIDPPSSHAPGQPLQNEGRIRTPLPSGPRPDKPVQLPPLPGFDNFRATLQGSADRILANPFRSRYAHVSVLMIRWQEDEDAAAQRGLEELERTFQEDYDYTVYVKTIPRWTDESRTPYLWLSQVLGDFVTDHNQRDCLKIFCYAGHSYLNANREPVLASSPHADPASVIRWDSIRHFFENTRADTLILMDCAYYPFHSTTRQEGMLELVAASAGEDHVELLGRGVFTRALADQLRTRAARAFLEPFSAAELHGRLLAVYPSLVKERHPSDRAVAQFPTPLILQLSGTKTLPSILLAPRRHQAQSQCQSQGHHGQAGPSSASSLAGSQHITITFRLTDDAFKLDSWAEWLRLMPSGITEARIDGPYRNTFQ
ncbi:hypothetical protein VTJ83DRAFT_2231 [Remersonia thermophila]|uniref:Uncharacterized protein n=1 Tax=Remersonia thermophila TaxID=72144 RepID=A0ABR4DKH0_9PEZI